MAGKTAILSVRILGDARGALDAMGAVEGKSGKLGGVLKGIGGAALGVATAGGAALVGLGVAGVKAAGDLEQSQGAVETIFKGSEAQMKAYAGQAATSLGLTKNEYNELASVLGTQLKNGGTSIDELAGKTNDLMGVGADLASMFGGSTADAVGALSSALKGERDPIERYGVSLTQAAIDAKAAELGFTKVGGSLSTEASQAATLALIMDQTADAHGNFGRETGTFAGQVQILSAQWGNFIAQIGTLLLPILTTMLGFVTGTIMPALQQFADLVGPHISAAIGQVVPWIAQFVAGLTGAASGASPLQGILAQLLPSFMQIGGAVAALIPSILSFAQTVIPLIVQGVMQLIPLIVQAATVIYTNVLPLIAQALPIVQNVIAAVIPAIIGAITTLLPVILQMIPPIVSIASTIMGVLGPAIQWLLPVITGILGALVTQIVGAIQIVTGVLNTVAALLRGDWAGAWQGVQQIISGVMTFISGMVQQSMTLVASIFGTTISGLQAKMVAGGAAIRNAAVSAFTSLVAGVSSLVQRLVAAVVGAVTGVQRSISAGFSAARSIAVSAFSSLVAGVTSLIGSLIGRIAALPGQIRSALGNLSSLLVGAGKDLIRGMINGVGSMAQALKDKASGLAGGAVSAIKSKLGIKSPSRVMMQVGRWTGEGFVKGIDRMTSAASGAMRDLVNVPAAPRLAPSAAGSSVRSAGRGAVRVEINFNGLVTDRVGVAREIRKVLDEYDLLVGP